MTRLFGLVRHLTLMFAALQFALPAILSVTDGASAAGGRNSASHIESKGDRDCKPPHTADCAVCRFLTATVSRGGPATVGHVAENLRAAAIARQFGDPSAVLAHLQRSRAPPMA